MSTYPRTEQEPAYYGGDTEKGDKGMNVHANDYDVQSGEQQNLHRDLKGRHMQMIAIGAFGTSPSIRGGPLD